MNADSPTQLNRQDVVLYVLAYVLWLVTLVMTIEAVLQFRVAVNAVWVAIQGSPYTLGLLDQLALLLGGLLGFIYVIFLEHDYRDAVEIRRTAQSVNLLPGRFASGLARFGVDILLRRFIISFAIPFCIFLLSLGILEVALRVIEGRG